MDSDIVNSPLMREHLILGISICTIPQDDLISGWWYTYPSEKYEFVSWDYDIPNILNMET